MWLLICPVSLSYDWQMGAIPLIECVSDKRNLATLALAIAMVAVVYTCCRSPRVSCLRLHFKQSSLCMNMQTDLWF